VLFGTLFSLTNLSFAQSDYGCKKKEDNLKIQLRYAEQHGNVARAENLKRAIINVHEHCGKTNAHDDLQLDDEVYQQNLNDKIAKQQDKVSSAEQELEQAKLSGKEKKIREKTAKLQDRQKKLEDYQQELKSLLAQ
jgi:vacuolar-type H+-ATPase subunit I/STV1